MKIEKMMIVVAGVGDVDRDLQHYLILNCLLKMMMLSLVRTMEVVSVDDYSHSSFDCCCCLHNQYDDDYFLRRVLVVVLAAFASSHGDASLDNTAETRLILAALD